MQDDLAPLERAAAGAFKTHLGTIIAALPMPVRSVDVRHVWRSGAEWHVETEVDGRRGQAHADAPRTSTASRTDGWRGGSRRLTVYFGTASSL